MYKVLHVNTDSILYRARAVPYAVNAQRSGFYLNVYAVFTYPRPEIFGIPFPNVQRSAGSVPEWFELMFVTVQTNLSNSIL